jgi:DNA repair ATPase RecN
VVVSKKVEHGKTFGSAQLLLHHDRISEIARMLSGGIADESAMAHAGDLLHKLGFEATQKATKKPPGS